MVTFPHAKINIGLFVTHRREDGYHNLETIFYPISVCDSLEILPASKSSLQVIQQQWHGDLKDNLVWRALQLMKSRFPDRVADYEMHLIKNIPTAAGLGGGSADAAFVLRILNEMAQLSLNTAQLQALALELGSDCPFFILNQAASATGRGEQLTPIQIDLTDYTLVVISSAIAISTQQAFANIHPKPASFDLNGISHLPISQWRGKVINDFETTVFNLHPALESVKDLLYAEGALFALLSGSGSAMYGIFPKTFWGAESLTGLNHLVWKDQMLHRLGKEYKLPEPRLFFS